MNKTKTTALILGALFFAFHLNAQKKEFKNDSEKRKLQHLPDPIPFEVAHGYFINYSVKGKITESKIETQARFDKIFGSAAVMGEDGLPTKIDFTKQYVIAVVKPDTQKETNLIPLSLQDNRDGKIIFTYGIKIGKIHTYISSPLLLIIVDKDHNGNIVINEKFVR